MIKLSEITIGEYEIRKRDGGDLWDWFKGIDSVVFPSSEKACVMIKGQWENCTISGKVSEASRSRLQLWITFSDATVFSVCAPRDSFLPEELQGKNYSEEEKQRKRQRSLECLRNAITQ